jgi:hypothetical protein
MGTLAKAGACEHDDLAIEVIRASDSYDKEFDLKV